MPWVDPRIFNKSFNGPARTITPQILALAKELSPDHEPLFAPLRPADGAKPIECFYNVVEHVEKNGGEILYGWAFWEWPTVFVEAEHHAVWKNGDILLDITPSPDICASTLFLPDPARVFDFAKHRRIINVKRPLTERPEIRAYVDLMDEYQNQIEAHSKGREIVFEGDDVDLMAELEKEIRYAQSLILLDLARQIRRKDPCFCRSGKRFKHCCAELIGFED